MLGVEHEVWVEVAGHSSGVVLAGVDDERGRAKPFGNGREFNGLGAGAHHDRDAHEISAGGYQNRWVRSPVQ
ncbi:hypothetical protein [Saccharopolyspora sp. 5N708]|uniref:hypothetical protein n=1 Tax=Saccharopolyspora sp. 5N708 TaxID=3457424 RepID=UPI003FD4BC54